MTNYVHYGGPKSRGFRSIWMLEELGAEYQLVPTPPHDPALAAVSALGKIPVLVADGVAISDSVAIVTYLADAHGALTFPAGTLDRARQDARTQFVVDELDGPLWTAAKHSFVLPEERRSRAAKDAAIWEWGTSMERLEAFLGDGPFLMGETMTIADIIAVHCLGWSVVAKFPPLTPRLRDYSGILRGRPAYQRARAAG